MYCTVYMSKKDVVGTRLPHSAVLSTFHHMRAQIGAHLLGPDFYLVSLNCQGTSPCFGNIWVSIKLANTDVLCSSSNVQYSSQSHSIHHLEDLEWLNKNRL
jgi:hypothetical protein